MNMVSLYRCCAKVLEKHAELNQDRICHVSLISIYFRAGLVGGREYCLGLCGREHVLHVEGPGLIPGICN